MKGHMKRDVEREKNNLFYLVNPAVSIEAESAYFQHLNENEPSADEEWFKLEKAKS